MELDADQCNYQKIRGMSCLEPRRLNKWERIYELSEKFVVNSALFDDEEDQNHQPINLSFAIRLRNLHKQQLYLQYVLACLSTLGGAYHLTAKPKTALAIAQYQEAVGYRLGSYQIIIRAKVFQAVNLGILGHRRKSNLLFKSLKVLLIQYQADETLISFVISSRDWLKRNYLVGDPKLEEFSVT